MLLSQRLAFSVGHVLNDFTAAVWFTYLVAYFQKVVDMGADWAGYIMLFGQIVDAVSTTFVGLESDQTRRSGLFNYGRRKTWHLFGTFCVIVSFVFIFTPGLGCTEQTTDWALFIYYAPFVAIFQFGWAAIQVEHLALIPELASDSEDLRASLAATRNDFTVASTTAVYLLVWFLFSSRCSDSNQLQPCDAPKFTLLTLILIAVGLVFTALFHVFVKENTEESTETEEASETVEKNHVQFDDRLSWFMKPVFYALIVLYTAVRVILNVSQTVMPLYILESLQLDKNEIATLPLAMYLAGFVASLATPFIHRCIGRRRLALLGFLLVLGSCVWIFFLDNKNSTVYFIYIVAVIIGAGQQIVYIASVTLTSDIIATNNEGKTTAAFVWGVLSFFDKIVNGIAIMIVQKQRLSNHSADYYRWIMSFMPGGSAVVGILAVVVMTVAMTCKSSSSKADNDRRALIKKSNYSSVSLANSPLKIRDNGEFERTTD